MFELTFTEHGIRAKEAPRRMAVDWVARRLPITRELTIALGDRPVCDISHTVFIPFQVYDCAELPRKTAQFCAFIQGLTQIWQRDIVLRGSGFAAPLLIESFCQLPRIGIARIELYHACSYALSTFLQLDMLDFAPAPIINHTARLSITQRRMLHHLPRFGPADRPIAEGYPFSHGFWTDIAA
ncbi:MAG: hypothetical protein AAF198_06715 [Pseudomonadota bacterium]